MLRGRTKTTEKNQRNRDAGECSAVYTQQTTPRFGAALRVWATRALTAVDPDPRSHFTAAALVVAEGAAATVGRSSVAPAAAGACAGAG